MCSTLMLHSTKRILSISSHLYQVCFASVFHIQYPVDVYPNTQGRLDLMRLILCSLASLSSTSWTSLRSLKSAFFSNFSYFGSLWFCPRRLFSLSVEFRHNLILLFQPRVWFLSQFIPPLKANHTSWMENRYNYWAR